MSWIITGTQKVNWDPSLISTALWLDAADASTVIESGGVVNQWNDKSSNGRNATAFNGPTYSSTGLSTGKPSISTNGTNQYFQSSVSTFNSSNSAQFFFVFQTPIAAQADTASERLFSFGNLGVNGGLQTGSTTGSLSGEKILLAAGQGASVTVAGSSFYSRSANSAQILSSTFASNGVSLRADGSAVSVDLGSPNGNFSPANTGFTSNSNILFGASFVGSVLFTNIAIKFSEIILLNTASSLDVTQRIEGYLAHKWGLEANLPSDHPYKVNPPAP